MKLKLSSQALSDHENRLYCSDQSTDTVKFHIDQPSSIYTIIKATKTVTTVEMSESAIKEYLADGDYQAEFNSEDKNPFGLMWSRATKSVRKQIIKVQEEA